MKIARGITLTAVALSLLVISVRFFIHKETSPVISNDLKEKVGEQVEENKYSSVVSNEKSQQKTILTKDVEVDKSTNVETSAVLQKYLKSNSPQFISNKEQDSLSADLMKIEQYSISMFPINEREYLATYYGNNGYYKESAQFDFELEGFNDRYVLMSRGTKGKYGSDLFIIDSISGKFLSLPQGYVLETVNNVALIYSDKENTFSLYTLGAIEPKLVQGIELKTGETFNSCQDCVDVGTSPDIKKTDDAFIVSVFREFNGENDSVDGWDGWEHSTRKLREIVIPIH